MGKTRKYLAVFLVIALAATGGIIACSGGGGGGDGGGGGGGNGGTPGQCCNICVVNNASECCEPAKAVDRGDGTFFCP